MKPLLFIFFSITIAVTSFAQTPVVGAGKEVDPYHYTSVKNVTIKHGCVVSAHPLASEVGLAMLKKGGNAFDAMIATQLALAVVYPAAGNLGGGGFTIARTKNDSLIALDYREMAPLKGSRNMYIDSAGNARTDWSQGTGIYLQVFRERLQVCFAEHKYAKLPFKELDTTGHRSC